MRYAEMRFAIRVLESMQMPWDGNNPESRGEFNGEPQIHYRNKVFF